MPTLHAYVDRTGSYVKHSFASQGRLYHVVYQVDPFAARRFAETHLTDGHTIPRGLFRDLLRDGHLFTQRSGASGEPFDPDCGDAGESSSLTDLSLETRRWITTMLINHPAVKIAGYNPEAKEIQIENIPDNYLTKLVEVARRYDGTDFFKNLELSYRAVIAKHKND